MHDFTTFEHTIPVYGDSDPIRKHMKKFKCQACNKDKFHIPLTTVDGRTVCIHCCMTGKGQDIVLDKRTVDALEAVANRINGTDNYPPKETTEPTTTNKRTKISLFDIRWKDIKHFYRKDNWPLIICDVIALSFPFWMYGTARFFLWLRGLV